MGTVVRINSKDKAKVLHWLSIHVGPQKYYLHTQVGGVGWRIKASVKSTFNNPYYELEVDDDQMATIIALKFT